MSDSELRELTAASRRYSSRLPRGSSPAGSLASRNETTAPPAGVGACPGRGQASSPLHCVGIARSCRSLSSSCALSCAHGSPSIRRRGGRTIRLLRRPNTTTVALARCRRRGSALGGDARARRPRGHRARSRLELRLLVSAAAGTGGGGGCPSAVAVKSTATTNEAVAHGNFLETAARTKPVTRACIRTAKARVCGINRDPQDTRHAPRGHGKEGVDGSSPSEGFAGFAGSLSTPRSFGRLRARPFRIQEIDAQHGSEPRTCRRGPRRPAGSSPVDRIPEIIL